jgi:hypothetical protein
MRFSLKDLMWSVAFASLGIVCIATFFKMNMLGNEYRALRLLLLFLVFPLLGAAIGKLLNQTKKYVSLIVVAQLIVWLFVYLTGPI